MSNYAYINSRPAGWRSGCNSSLEVGNLVYCTTCNRAIFLQRAWTDLDTKKHYCADCTSKQK